MARRKRYAERPERFRLATPAENTRSENMCFFGGGAHYGTTHYNDSSVYENAGTMTSAGWAIENGRYGFSGDGSARYTNLRSSFPFSETTPVTISWWERFTSVTVAYPSVACLSFLESHTHRAIILRPRLADDAAYRYLALGTADGVGIACNTIPAPATDSINHVAVVAYAGLDSRTANEYSFFWNGVNVGTGTGGCTFGALTDAYNYIGWDGTDGKFSGDIYDFSVWSRVLSLGEIQTLADRSDPMLDGLLVGVANRSRVAFSSGGTTNYYIPNKMRYYRNRRTA